MDFLIISIDIAPWHPQVVVVQPLKWDDPCGHHLYAVIKKIAQYHGKPKGWGENTDFPAFEMAILGVSIGDSGRERLVSLSSFSSTVAAVW